MSRSNSAVRPALLRRMNAVAVLNAIRSSESPTTASDLMEATKISRTTVHGVCEDLIEAGWVREVESRRADDVLGTGRPARRYEFNSNRGYVLGVDIGVYKTTALLANLRGDVVAETTTVFNDPRVPSAERIAAVRECADDVVAMAGVSPSRILALGVGLPGWGAPGPFAVSDELQPWVTDEELRVALRSSHGWPILLENDANLAMLAERWRGVAAGTENVIVMLAGERLGSGLFIDGRLLRGRMGGAGEMGFLDMVEHVGSARGIAWQVRQIALEVIDEERAHQRNAVEQLDATSADAIFNAARSGSRLALTVLERLAVKVAHTIAPMAIFLNPELVVISGAVAQGQDLFLPRVRELLPALTRTPPRLDASPLGAEAVALGGARLALDFVELRAPDLSESTFVEER